MSTNTEAEKAATATATATATGSCACGAIKYTVTGPSKQHYLCHCHNCQKFSGSAFGANCYYAKAQFNLAQGEDSLKQYRDISTDSGQALLKHFCSNCGCPIFDVCNDDPGVISIKSGSLDNRENFKPVGELYKHRKYTWLGDLGMHD